MRAAIELAKITSEDPMGGNSRGRSSWGRSQASWAFTTTTCIRSRTRSASSGRGAAEKAALAVDARLTNSEGGTFDASIGRKVLANSHGFVGEYRSSYCSISAVPIASDEAGNMQRDYWYSVARTLAKLESPEEVGRIAAERTLRRLGARKIKTQKVPIVFDRQTAGVAAGPHLRRGQRRRHLPSRVVSWRASWGRKPSAAT